MVVMRKHGMILGVMLAFGIVVVGCSRQGSAWVIAASRVRLPASALDQSRLLSYAQSPVFTKQMKAQVATNGWPQVSIAVDRPDSGILEFTAVSLDTQTAVRVASLMASQMTAFAVAHKLDEVQVIRPAVVVDR